MPDNMQTEALERLKQMYSKAQPSGNAQQSRVTARPVPQHGSESSKSENIEAHNQNYEIAHSDKAPNMLDIFMKDKEKSLIVLLIVLLISEKADTTLILALMYLIL